MQLELLLNNDPQAIPVVRVLVHEALAQLCLEAAGVEELKEFVLAAVGDSVSHAYPEDEEGSIKLTIRESHGKLEIRVRDYGMPRDIESLERRLHETGVPAALFGSSATTVADQLHWRGYGPKGKELQIIKWLCSSVVGQNTNAGGITSFRDEETGASEHEYKIRRMFADEAVQVSKLIYRAYGNTYFNEDVYYPERLAAQNAHNVVLSFVAQGEDGAIVGHYALELHQAGPVAEGGQAVVHPDHRGRGLLDRMRDAAIEEAQRLHLIGWFADAVSVHTRTQKSHVTHGGHLTGVDLGIAPRSERFRKIADEQPQRVTCLLYFHWLTEPASRTIYVPPQHQAVVSRIYENLGCKFRIGAGESPTGHGRLTVSMDNGAGKAFVRVEGFGVDTVRSIRHAKRELVERSGAEVVYIELPVENPATPTVVNLLETDGFGFVGVAPHFATCGDMLRLAYLVEPLAREPIKTFEKFADDFVDYVLSEQTRVCEKLEE